MWPFVVVSVLALASRAFSYTMTYALTYDAIYDDGQNSLNKVTCSHGEYGLITDGYSTFDSLPTFPYIGGAPQILSLDSPYCGSCWELTYTDAQGVSTSLNFTAIDKAGDRPPEGFDISVQGMDLLTSGQAKRLHTVPITAVRKPKSACGL